MDKFTIGFVILTVLFIAVFALNEYTKPKQMACTLEAKLCSDGSAIGRTGPNCEFAKCPGEK